MTGTADLRERFIKDEKGFTLSEMMVTIIIMMVVLLALFSIFDMSMKIFSFGNNKAEAVESARIGMEKMEREIRQAYRYNNAASQTHLFFDTATPTTALAVPPTARTDLTFGNETGSPGDGQITCASPSECITYELTNANGTALCTGATCTLWRANGTTTTSGPVVENVAPGGLSFTLLKSDGTAPANEGEVGMVLVKLNVIVDQGIGKNGTQTLTTVIDLRNRS